MTTGRTLRALSLSLLLGTPLTLLGCVADDDIEGLRDTTAAVKSCTAEEGQLLVDAGRYEDALRVLSCVIKANPTEIEGYRARIEAELLLGRYSDAVRDYARVNAFVVPVHPDAAATITNSYTDRLAAAPGSIPALMGLSFARWWFFDYAQAVHALDQLLAIDPNNVYGNLFRGSSHLLRHATTAEGVADLEKAIALAPASPDVRYVVADAYTYGLPDPQRALAEATFALSGGLDTPRVHAILGTAHSELGNAAACAMHTKRHIDLVTTELLPAPPLAAGAEVALDMVPGRTYEIPLALTAGQPIDITTASQAWVIWDSILVVLAPDGTPVVGADDTIGYMAGITNWVAPQTATYRLRVTSFEAVFTGELDVARD